MTPEQEQKQRYEEWRRKLAGLAEQSRNARKSLAERVARQNDFQYLQETIGQKPEDFPEILDNVAEAYLSGRFFLIELSLFYQVSPRLSLTVYELRQQWAREYELKTIPEFLLLDQAMLAYFHTTGSTRKWRTC
jgi:hypothetical protein